MSEHKKNKANAPKPAQNVEKAPASKGSTPAVKASTQRGSSAAPETAEPIASRSVPLPMILVVLLGLFVYLADAYVIDNSGAFHASVYYPEKKVPTVVGGVDGKFIFGNYCTACHQPTGMGNRQLNFPPLAGSEWVEAEGPNRLIRIVLNGLNGPIEVKGEQYNNVMLPWKDTMTDEQIAAVLTYVRSSWGSKASAVTPEQVAAIRADTANRPNNWTAAELLKIPVID